MPIHDWSRVDAGIVHDFHHAAIEQIDQALNGGILPSDQHALAERHAGKLEPDVPTLQAARGDDDEAGSRTEINPGGGLRLAPPRPRFAAETERDFYRRNHASVTVRHMSGDVIVARVEVVSPGNKSSRSALGKFVKKAAELFEHDIHRLVLDLQPPTARDPHGIHAAIGDEVAGEDVVPAVDKPFRGHKLVPLEATYESAWETVPRRWRRVVEGV